MFRSILAGFVLVTVLFGASLATADPITDRIGVTMRGHGPDVILIPGLASSGAVWDATATQLEARYRVHVVQVAGFAGAPAGANAQGPVLQPTLDAIDAYIKTNGLKAPVVIGHSLGGLLGLMLADQHPEDVGRLMIVDSLPFFGALMGASDVAAIAPRAAAMRDSIIGGTQEAYEQGEERTMAALVKTTEARKIVIGWADASDKSVVARFFFEDMTTDMRPKLAGIATKVTMLYPWDASTGMPQAAFDGMYQGSYAALPNKTITRIDGSYHFIMLDQPALFAAQVEEFLK
jgi:pimeloyl-ACP methyl ester carboxylesterase